MNIKTLTCTAGTPKEFSFPTLFRGWRIVSAPVGAVLGLTFDDKRDATSAVKGNYGRLSVTSRQIIVTSTITGPVTVEWSEDGAITYDFPDFSAAGGLFIQGQYPNLTNGQDLTTGPRLVSTGMFTRDGLGALKSVPVMTPEVAARNANAWEMAVGFNDRDFLENVGADLTGTVLCAGYAQATFEVAGAWTGQATLKDGSNNVLPYHDGNGVYCPSGIIPSGYTGLIYVKLAGSVGGTLSIVRVGGAGNMACTGNVSRIPGAPVTITAPAGVREHLVWTGPLAAGINGILGGVMVRAGYKVRVYGFDVSFDAATNAQFYAVDGLGATPVTVYKRNTTGWQDVDQPVFETDAAQEIYLYVSGPVNGGVNLRFEYVPA